MRVDSILRNGHITSWSHGCLYLYSPLIRRHGSEAHPRDLADNTVALGVPAGHCVIQCREEREEHQHEEERQKGVVDDIEDRNLH